MTYDNDSQRTVLIFRSLFDLLDVVLMFLSFILQICKSFQNYWQKVSLNISSQNVWETLQVMLGSSVQIWYYTYVVSKICFKRKRSLVFFFHGDLIYKPRRVKGTANILSMGSKKIRENNGFDPVIIERTISFVLYPSTTIYRSFLKHYSLTNKAVGAMWRTLSKLLRGDGYCSASPLIVRRDSCSPLILARVQTPRII